MYNIYNMYKYVFDMIWIFFTLLICISQGLNPDSAHVRPTLNHCMYQDTNKLTNITADYVFDRMCEA